jgi:hypothetical protein
MEDGSVTTVLSLSKTSHDPAPQIPTAWCNSTLLIIFHGANLRKRCICYLLDIYKGMQRAETKDLVYSGKWPPK